MPNPPTGPAAEADSVPANEVTTDEERHDDADALTELAHRLAHSQTTTAGTPAPPYLLQELDHLGEFLESTYRAFAETTEERLLYSTAAEWMLDNFYIVQQALRIVEEDLPQGYYDELPQLTGAGDSRFAGYPRVYGLSRALVTHSQSQLEEEHLRQFVGAYQSVQNLTMGELWAVPIMLRYSVLEALAGVAARLIDGKRNGAPPSTPAYDFDVAEEELVANSILSLRLLATLDWQDFFEELSAVEQALRRDPTGIYANMTFETRDQYRTEVEKLARYSDRSEKEVAESATYLARVEAAQNGAVSVPEREWQGLSRPRQEHVGHYLLGAGRGELERQTEYAPPARVRLGRFLLEHPTLVYLGSIGILTLILLIALLWYGSAADGRTWQLILIAVLALVPAITVAVSLVNWLATLLTEPRILPKLNFEEGVSASCRTMVVVPCMLTGTEEVDSLLEQLELHYLRNGDPELGFALLSDFADAEAEEAPEDAALLERTLSGVEQLNERYSGAPFYLFHRQRLWNTSEQVWMGWERKRGKLHEFNRLLRGDTDTSFSVQEGDLEFLPAVRYVITLDADTILPTESAARLIGTLAHPLNQAQFDAQERIAAGYTILQPRTEIRPTSAAQSLFTRVFGGDVGLDLYTRAVSDVYQDLFGEGLYVGKGIYDVDAFEKSLAGRAPENRLLSHDLFEGVHGRAGLVTDIVLYEEYPAHYLTFIRRSHRWIRGDWQLLPWLFPRVPAQKGTRPNDLAPVALWKIFDNLRRSLLAPALFFLFLGGWTILPGSPLLWTFVGLLAPAVALVTSVFAAVIRRLGGATWREVRRPLRDSVIRWLLQIALIPFETLLILDAVFTTLNRLFITRRDLLQWKTAAHTARLIGPETSASVTLREMLPSMLLTLVAAVVTAAFDLAALLVALPLLILWLVAPRIAHWISRPAQPPVFEPSAEQIERLRVLARHTWLFFERFVGPEDNWLPPDHFQEQPRGAVAHRTSPTNVGLYLLTTLGAFDLGYIGLMNLTVRLTSTMDTLDRLDRHRGHVLNWIDTTNLRPLPPRYVSTVDSGNLAASLLALKEGLLALKQRPVWEWERWQGLVDTLLMLEQSALMVPDDSGERDRLLTHLRQVRGRIDAARETPEAWAALLTQFTQKDQPQLERLLVNLLGVQTPDLSTQMIGDWRLYAERLRFNAQEMEQELKLLLPWLWDLVEAPSLFRDESLPREILEGWNTFLAEVERIPTYEGLVDLCDAGDTLREELERLCARYELDEEIGDAAVAYAHAWCQQVSFSFEGAAAAAAALISTCGEVAERAVQLVNAMDFTFLFNKQRQVFHIGYNGDSGRLDPNYYDLLASECRIASIVAIAKGDVPNSHWLHLARPLADIEGDVALLSWSGTMFEYLMPPLLMESFRGTLLSQSAQAVVEKQMQFGAERGVPWGVSESGFYTFDNAQNYQYRAFGVPGLGFKRGLGEDTVITPYASLLALPVRPDAVLENIERLDEAGMASRFGYYEAIDYTQSRLELGQEAAIVRSFMAHHQGMILLALLNYLQDDIMVRRFHSVPRIQSVELLLQEQVPDGPPMQEPHAAEAAAETRAVRPAITADPWSVPPETPMPHVHYLSNGRFATLITNAGSGYSRGEEVAYTRWRPDTTLDNWGLWIYVDEPARRQLWSAGIQPSRTRPERYEVDFFPHQATFRRHDHGIALDMEVTVAPGEDVEVRRITLSNETGEERRLRLTSYGEVVLTDQATDARHQAFAKLFVESEYLPELNALFFRRRPRSAHEAPRFMGHMLIAAGDVELSRRYESDRAAFLGRTRSDDRPAALGDDWLGGQTGATLDPIMALGQEVTLAAHASVEVAFLTFAAPTRERLLQLARDYQRWALVERAFAGARTQAEQDLRQLDLPVDALRNVQRLLSLLLYPHRALRADQETLRANSKGQAGLWAYGISGDYPILLVKLADEADGGVLQEALRAHAYWRRRGLMIDLVVLNEQETNYGQSLQGFIRRLVEKMESEQWFDRRGGIFVLRRDQMSNAEQILLQTVARVILDAGEGSIAEHLDHIAEPSPPLPQLITTRDPADITESTPPLPPTADLQFDNGFGGFSDGGKEYVLYMEPGEHPPAPWINVIANEVFGFLVSESGGGYTWSINSGENRLSTWRNDPVTDMPSEALYLRDEETGEVWSPLPQPAPANAAYEVRHGAGYSVFNHHSHRLKQRTRLFVDPEAPVKVVQLRLQNTSEKPRRVTATFYAEWVLGTSREVTQPYIVPSYSQESRALLARNAYNEEFGGRIAFVTASREPHGFSTDRTEFLGRVGSMRQPAALRRVGLDNRINAGVDTCAAMQLHFDLAPGADEEAYFLLGQAEDEDAAVTLTRAFGEPARVRQAWEETQTLWNDVLGTVQVETPEPAMDLLLNRWLLYQALSCRIWGRSALYQSSGAYGFRDQLQDVMSLVLARPDLTRAQLLRAARHQFRAGDVLHWWHPPSGRGVRTRITDDLVWLPYVTAHYVRATGDLAVLDEQVPFLIGEPLRAEEEERYGFFESTQETYSLFEHCARALERATTEGRNGLPLMGGGDWNDGMNRVGIEGKGESVWLAWFLASALEQFAEIAAARDEDERARTFRRDAEGYKRAVEENAWDGAWYRRAYYDDGTPLGSWTNDECQIDSLPQSWAVLTGGGDLERLQQAMAAVRERLVDDEARLIRLFTPPFDQTPKDPGYIKGYLPGVRENGGQYTHAALWAIWAYAQMGDGTTAESLFRMINPILRSATPADAEVYRVEPYVISADVYGVEPHVGRGGWTWYTGSSGWMYRLGVEGILGLRLEADALVLEPHIPPAWDGYTLRVRDGETTYEIVVQSEGDVMEVAQVSLDGETLPSARIPRLRDGRHHQVEVVLARVAASA